MKGLPWVFLADREGESVVGARSPLGILRRARCQRSR
jgi:hypothetical protein